MDNVNICNKTITGSCGTVEDDIDNDDEDVFGESFIPSISDRLQIGYASMDRACQTEVTEIVNLKKMTEVLAVVVNDLSMLKRGLYFSKLTLQAEYDGRLETVALELFNRVNQRIAEIEAIHKERIDVIRRSYKTQMANALTKLSRDYHLFYGSKDAMVEAENKKKVEEMKKHQDMTRKNELAQKEMYEMLRLQMEEAKAKEAEIPSRKSSVVSVSGFIEEIEELNKSLKDYESRVDYLEECLEETTKDNKKLNAELDDKNNKLRQEQRKAATLTKDLQEMKQKMEQEREDSLKRLEVQKVSLKNEMENRIGALRIEHQKEVDQKLEDAKKGQSDLLRQQKLAEEIKIKELMAKQAEQKVVVNEIPQDTDVSNLMIIEKKQRAEIACLTKKIDQLSKLSEMKVKVLNEHIHSLKTEMFLRTTLQRQTAKVKQATVTYVKKGSDVVPLGFQPCVEKIQRKHRLPSIIGTPAATDDNTRSNSLSP